MEALQKVLAVIGAIVGAVTALLTLYAKYLDIKKATRDLNGTGPSAAAAPTQVRTPGPAPQPPAPHSEPIPVATLAQPIRDSAGFGRALQTVRAPALALLVAGAISLSSNLFMAAFAYVDEFVTPLTTQTQERRAREALLNAGAGPAMPRPPGELSDQTSIALAIVTFLSFALAGAMATWAGYEMLRLRSYWLSVAGSVAIMPGACMCCFAGFPVGIWSLSVLLRPEVSASFR
jgi:hypothetical protein